MTSRSIILFCCGVCRAAYIYIQKLTMWTLHVYVFLSVCKFVTPRNYGDRDWWFDIMMMLYVSLNWILLLLLQKARLSSFNKINFLHCTCWIYIPRNIYCQMELRWSLGMKMMGDPNHVDGRSCHLITMIGPLFTFNQLIF